MHEAESGPEAESVTVAETVTEAESVTEAEAESVAEAVTVAVAVAEESASQLANSTINQWTDGRVDFRAARNLGLKSLILCFLPTSLFLFLPFSG